MSFVVDCCLNSKASEAARHEQNAVWFRLRRVCVVRQLSRNFPNRGCRKSYFVSTRSKAATNHVGASCFTISRSQTGARKHHQCWSKYVNVGSIATALLLVN